MLLCFRFCTFGFEVTPHSVCYLNLLYTFWSVAIFWTGSETSAQWSKQQKVAKTISKSFSLSNSSQKPPVFAFLMYGLYGHPRDFNSKWKYQQYRPCFQTIFSFLMTMTKLNLYRLIITRVSMKNVKMIDKYKKKKKKRAATKTLKNDQ